MFYHRLSQVTVIYTIGYHRYHIYHIYHMVRYIPYGTIPYHTIWCHTVPYHTIPYHMVPYIPYGTICTIYTIGYHRHIYHRLSQVTGNLWLPVISSCFHAGFMVSLTVASGHLFHRLNCSLLHFLTCSLVWC